MPALLNDGVRLLGTRLECPPNGSIQATGMPFTQTVPRRPCTDSKPYARSAAWAEILVMARPPVAATEATPIIATVTLARSRYRIEPTCRASGAPRRQRERSFSRSVVFNRTSSCAVNRCSPVPLSCRDDSGRAPSVCHGCVIEPEPDNRVKTVGHLPLHGVPNPVDSDRRMTMVGARWLALAPLRPTWGCPSHLLTVCGRSAPSSAVSVNTAGRMGASDCVRGSGLGDGSAVLPSYPT